VHEVKHQNNFNQLGEVPTMFQECAERGLKDGGSLINTNSIPPVVYIICFEYEDEHGNDCGQTEVIDGEDHVCISKNYILLRLEH